MFGLDGGYMQKLLNSCVTHVREDGWPGATGAIPWRPRGLRDPASTGGRVLARGGLRHPAPVLPQLAGRSLAADLAGSRGRRPWQEGAAPSSRTRQAFAWLPVDEHLPDRQPALIDPFVQAWKTKRPSPSEREGRYNLRAIANAIFYQNLKRAYRPLKRSGCGLPGSV